MVSPYPAIELAKYALVEQSGHVRLIPSTKGGKRITGPLFSDDTGWDGAANAGGDIAERFESASTRQQELRRSIRGSLRPAVCLMVIRRG